LKLIHKAARYRNRIIAAYAIARATAYAVEQPADVNVNEAVRPIGQKAF
jgi:NADP-dependent 3-hydroxy acid dehydrogenase YdfG